MQTWDAIASRRNVRSFADRPIPAAELDQILEAGRRAPSSQNWQPWDFIVVTDRRQLRSASPTGGRSGRSCTAAAGKAPPAPGPGLSWARSGQRELGEFVADGSGVGMAGTQDAGAVGDHLAVELLGFAAAALPGGQPGEGGA
jgi:nitroreductase